MEFALTDRWSAKAEYMHYEFPQEPPHQSIYYQISATLAESYAQGGLEAMRF